MKSEILAVSDLSGIHVGKSMEILLSNFRSSGDTGILFGVAKDEAGYKINLGGMCLSYGHPDAAVTRIRMYQ